MNSRIQRYREICLPRIYWSLKPETAFKEDRKIRKVFVSALKECRSAVNRRKDTPGLILSSRSSDLASQICAAILKNITAKKHPGVWVSATEMMGIALSSTFKYERWADFTNRLRNKKIVVVDRFNVKAFGNIDDRVLSLLSDLFFALWNEYIFCLISTPSSDAEFKLLGEPLFEHFEKNFFWERIGK